jgi:hypothetical protein
VAENAHLGSSWTLRRERLQALEVQLRSAGRESDQEGFTSISVHLAECADEIRTVLQRPLPLSTLDAASLIARVEHALKVWRYLSEV